MTLMIMMCRLRSRRRLTFGVVFAVSGLLQGCGKDGPERFRLSGQVTFEGKPVPSGMISFEPKEKGIGGGYAPIVNGTYDTDLTGRGHLGGEHSIQIAGFAGVARPDDPEAPAVPMFKPLTITRDLPKETTTMDFLLPLSDDAQPASH